MMQLKLTEEFINQYGTDIRELPEGNGCGSDWFSIILCRIALLPFNSVNTKLLQDCFKVHDLEYGVDRKSEEHKYESDSNLESNIEDIISKDSDSSYKKYFGRILHSILVLKGDKAYGL